jgi:hypothetical protein
LNKTNFAHPRDSYPDLIRAFYADLNGAEAAEPPVESQAENWWCRSQTSRGELFEKAGYSMLHIADGKIYNSPGSIKFFETLAYPMNPRVPGFIFLMNLNQTEATGQTVVLFIDLFFQNNLPNPSATEIFEAAIKPVYDRHDKNFAERYMPKTSGIMAGLASGCGVMNLYKASDADPFIDELLHASLAAYREILALTRDDSPTDEDYATMNRHRARLVEWLTVSDIGIQFAMESGVPLPVIEAYGYPPVVRY